MTTAAIHLFIYKLVTKEGQINHSVSFSFLFHTKYRLILQLAQDIHFTISSRYTVVEMKLTSVLQMADIDLN